MGQCLIYKVQLVLWFECHGHGHGHGSQA